MTAISASQSPESSFQVTLLADDGGEEVRFSCPAKRSIFLAALAAGYELTVGCTQGGCAMCRARLVSGRVISTKAYSPYAASDPAKRDDGYVLLCAVTPLQDIVVRPRSPWRTLPK